MLGSGSAGGQRPVSGAEGVLSLTTSRAVIKDGTRAWSHQRVTAQWSRQDAHRVWLVIGVRGPVEWLLARELLARGGGEGDVRVDLAAEIYPLGKAVRVTLSSPMGFAEVYLPADWTGTFVEAMLAEVPLGEERNPFGGDDTGWMDELRRLTNGGAQ